MAVFLSFYVHWIQALVRGQSKLCRWNARLHDTHHLEICRRYMSIIDLVVGKDGESQACYTASSLPLRLAADIKQLLLEKPDIDAKNLRFYWSLRIRAAAFRKSTSQPPRLTLSWTASSLHDDLEMAASMSLGGHIADMLSVSSLQCSF